MNEPEAIGNTKKLLNLGAHMGDDILRELLAVAIKSLGELSADLEQAVIQDNTKKVFETAHSIKGACGSMFAVKVCRIARDIEKNYENQIFINDILPEFIEAVSETQDWWKSHIGSVTEKV